MGDSFEESAIFDQSLSIWKGITHSKDGSFSYEDKEFAPIPLDIYTAASLGEDELVQDIIDKSGLKLKEVNSGGWSALMYASYMGHNDTVQCLLEKGADPNQRSPLGYTSLILASMCGNEGTMQVLLQKGANIEAVDKRGWTALFHAASAGHQQTTEFLLRCGANCETVEPSQGLTPLMEASASGHEIIVQQLLQNGANITRQDYNGENASTLALAYGHMKIASLIDQFIKSQKPTFKSPAYNYKNQKTSGNQNTNNKCGQSGPSIHAGPKEFAQMTGIGPDGKPHPHANVPIFLQDQPSHVTDVVTRAAKWEGPKDLETLLTDIGCSKHIPVFKEQAIDLHVFLTLSETDLKEIGIKIFGPRRKMMLAIDRLRKDIQGGILSRMEQIYADSLSASLQSTQSNLKETKKEVEVLEAQIAQERELRKVTEGVLMEHKEMWSSLRRLSEKWASAQVRLTQAVDQVKTQSQQFDKLHTVSRTAKKDKANAEKSIQEVDNILLHTRDYMLKMQNVLQRATSSSPVVSSNKVNSGTS
ncbi:ankyrin repeat and SAM domain-containing protein 3-like [Clavelina lepadiformis]|uniref:ankyrin repeat and SAM domain-containing protein 3-like n=1 Tax=Clavelina lepadiformis TaxID=159417 RepID=UPI004041B407